MEKFKAAFTAFFTAVFSLLGVLAVPVILLALSNIVDYITGLMAAPHRDEAVSSYRGLRGIIKKVGLWVLVLVGAMIDILLQYAADTIGWEIDVPFIMATLVAIWLVCNELISILENLIDIGIDIPPFLTPIIKLIKNAAEDKAGSSTDNTEEEDKEDKE